MSSFMGNHENLWAGFFVTLCTCSSHCLPATKLVWVISMSTNWRSWDWNQKKRPKTLSVKALQKPASLARTRRGPNQWCCWKSLSKTWSLLEEPCVRICFFRESNTRPATISYSRPEVFLFSQEVVFSPILFAIHIIWGPVSKTSLKQNFLEFFKLFLTYCEQLRPSQSGCRGNGGHQEISGNVFIPRVSRKCLCFRMRKTPLVLATNL